MVSLIHTQVGFAKRDPDRLKIAIENTYHLIWIRATKQVRIRLMTAKAEFWQAPGINWRVHSQTKWHFGTCALRALRLRGYYNSRVYRLARSA